MIVFRCKNINSLCNKAKPRMIRRILPLIFSLLLVGCEEGRPKADISTVEKTARFHAFDQAFFESDTALPPQEIDRLAREYPAFFAAGKNLKFWKAQRTDEKQQELYRASQEVFDDRESLNENLNFSMKHFYWYFPQPRQIKFYSYISNLDFDYPVLFADSVCFAALDLYLGPKKPYYQSLPEYQAFYRQPAFLVRDCIEAVLSPQVKGKGDGNLLDDMVFHGKKLYLLQQLMPQKEEKIVLQYTPAELQFCRENERTIWAYFIENNYLFSASQDLKRRFIDLAPFSKFRMKFDNETPGMIGRWVGWRIVSAYMEKYPEVSMKDLAAETDSRKILKLSGYKP